MPSAARLVRRELKSGPRYYIKWECVPGYCDHPHAGESREHMTFAAVLKKDAAALRVEKETELAAQRKGTAPKKIDTETTLREWCLAWVEGVVVKEHTRGEYRRLLNDEAGIVGKYGSRPLAAFTRADVKAWMAERAKAGASRNTVRNAVAVVRTALGDAVEEGKLTANPAALPKRKGQKGVIPGRAPLKVTPPAQEDVDKVLDAALPWFHVVLLLAASSGLRCGEVYALKWSDLSDDARTIAVSRSNNRGEIVDTKTEAGERIVPLFKTVRAALLEWRIASRHSQDDDLIFGDEFGRPVYATSVNDHELQRTFKRAGLSDRAWRFHSLRHYAVSRLIEQGANIVLVSKVAGHSDPSITLAVYSHMMGTGAADAADKYDPVKEAVNAL